MPERFSKTAQTDADGRGSEGGGEVVGELIDQLALCVIFLIMV